MTSGFLGGTDLGHYVTLDVQLMFHSFHAANAPPERVAAIGAAIGTQHAPLNPAATLTYPGITMPAVMTASAACNNMWISCPNSSAPESMWPAFFVRSDGITIGRLERNVAGVLISAVDTGQDLYDSTGPWRRRAIAGVLHSGELAKDDRPVADLDGNHVHTLGAGSLNPPVSPDRWASRRV